VGPFDTQETSGSIVPSLTFAFLEAVSFSVKSTATEVHLNIHYRVPIIVGLEIVAHRGYEVDDISGSIFREVIGEPGLLIL